MVLLEVIEGEDVDLPDGAATTLPSVPSVTMQLKVSMRHPIRVDLQQQPKPRPAPRGGLTRQTPPMLAQLHALDPARAPNRLPYKLLPPVSTAPRGMNRSRSSGNGGGNDGLPLAASLLPSASLPQLPHAAANVSELSTAAGAKLQSQPQPTAAAPPPSATPSPPLQQQPESQPEQQFQHAPPPQPPPVPPPQKAPTGARTGGVAPLGGLHDISDAHASGGAPPPPPLPLPLLRNRERIVAMRRSPLLAELPEAALQRLAASAVEKECKKYHALRPTRSVCVLVQGSFANKEGSHIALTGPMPPELLATAPDPATATAAGAIALECAVAGEASEGGATLGLANLVGGLVTVPPSFLATQPSLLLQLPVEVMLEVLPRATLATLGTEARVRMLLAHPAFVELSPPVAAVRRLAALTTLEAAQSGAKLFDAGEPCEVLRILLSGRVDLLKATGGHILRTVHATMTPPLGEAPTPCDAPSPQPYGAVAAESGCLLLCGGAEAHEALQGVLAPPQVVDSGGSGGAGAAGGAAGGGGASREAMDAAAGAQGSALLSVIMAAKAASAAAGG